MTPKIECNLPNNTVPLPDPNGAPCFTKTHFVELDFPRKLKGCDVLGWCGAECRGRYEADESEVWLLAPNIIKVNCQGRSEITYNATIEVIYHDTQSKE